MNKGIYRIIDANFNRAREALRVIEEICRFILDNPALTERVKSCRHELSAVVAKLDGLKLLAGRDTQRDVGTKIVAKNQLIRGDLNDCLIAACKRLPEALRVLAETIQTIDTATAGQIEQLRYRIYTLERDVMMMCDTKTRFEKVRLYVVITSNLPGDILSLTAKVAAGGADCIQLRAKDIPDDRLFATASEFADICRDYNVLSIINDRLDVSIASGADGVHLGQNDLPIDCVNKLQTRPMITGKSTHNLRQLERALTDDPTYVAVGPVYSTSTKPDIHKVGIEYVKAAKKKLKDSSIRSVAIGGINLDNIQQTIDAGADVIAICSAITYSSDPAATTKIFKEKIQQLVCD